MLKIHSRIVALLLIPRFVVEPAIGSGDGRLTSRPNNLRRATLSFQTEALAEARVGFARYSSYLDNPNVQAGVFASSRAGLSGELTSTASARRPSSTLRQGLRDFMDAPPGFTATAAEFMQHTQRPRRAVQNELSGLRDLGLLTRRKTGRSYRYALAPWLAQALQEYPTLYTMAAQLPGLNITQITTRAQRRQATADIAGVRFYLQAKHGILPLYRAEDRQHIALHEEYAMEVARNLDSDDALSPDDQETLWKASLLHDLGRAQVDYHAQSQLNAFVQEFGLAPAFNLKTSEYRARVRLEQLELPPGQYLHLRVIAHLENLMSQERKRLQQAAASSIEAASTFQAFEQQRKALQIGTDGSFPPNLLTNQIFFRAHDHLILSILKKNARRIPFTLTDDVRETLRAHAMLDDVVEDVKPAYVRLAQIIHAADLMEASNNQRRFDRRRNQQEWPFMHLTRGRSAINGLQDRRPRIGDAVFTASLHALNGLRSNRPFLALIEKSRHAALDDEELTASWRETAGLLGIQGPLIAPSKAGHYPRRLPPAVGGSETGGGADSADIREILAHSEDIHIAGQILRARAADIAQHLPPSEQAIRQHEADSFQFGIVDSIHRLRQKAVDRLDAALQLAVENPLQSLRNDEDLLREPLVSRVGNNEITWVQFMSSHVNYALSRLRPGARCFIGLSGTELSGKSTLASMLQNKIVNDHPGVRNRIVLFHEFAVPPEDWDRRKFVSAQAQQVSQFSRFIHALRANRLAVKMLYDREKQKPVTFQTNSGGQVVIVIGDRTHTITLHDDGTFSLQDTSGSESRDDAVNSMHEHIDNVSVRAPGGMSSGETWLSLQSQEGGLRIVIEGQEYFVRAEPGLNRRPSRYFLRTNGLSSEEPLRQDRPTRALEVWRPLAGDQRSVIVVEGTGILEVEDVWDLTATINASRMIRLYRFLMRAVRGGTSRDTREAKAHEFIENQRDSEDLLARLDDQAKKRPHHFQISSLSPAELVLRHFWYGLISPRNADQDALFIGQGIHLGETLHQLRQSGRETLLRWLRQVRAEQQKTGEPLRYPQSLKGEGQTTPAQIHERYFAGHFRTFQVGRLLLKWEEGIASLSSETVDTLNRLLERSQGIFVGAQVVDLTRQLGGPLLVEYVRSSGPEVEEVELRRVLVTNHLPYLEGLLKQLARAADDDSRQAATLRQEGKVRRAKAAEKAAQDKLAEGKRLMDDFFALQELMWSRGIVDRTPQLMHRYGLGSRHGKPHVFAVAPSSLLVNDESGSALREIDDIAREEEASSLHGHRPDLAARLHGYQRRFIGQGSDDYLTQIPEVFRDHYVQMVEQKVPVNADGLQIGKNFGHAWRESRKDQREQFRNPGVSDPVIDADRLSFLERIWSRTHGRKLAEYFDSYFSKAEGAPGNPQLAWSALFLRSLPPDPANALYAMADDFYRRLLRNPRWLIEVLEAEHGYVDNVAETILHHLSLRPDAITGWEEESFKDFVRHVASLEYTWSAFKRWLRAERLRQGEFSSHAA